MTAQAFVTPQPWRLGLQHASYGSEATYRKVAEWVGVCPRVDDWGGSTGHLRRYLPESCVYRVIDGTEQYPGTVLANLVNFVEPCDGIVLRHVLDNTFYWSQVLSNALKAFRHRLAVVTFTKDAQATQLAKVKSAWPIWHFNPDDLRRHMDAFLVREEQVHETHPERVYYLERHA